MAVLCSGSCGSQYWRVCLAEDGLPPHLDYRKVESSRLRLEVRDLCCPTSRDDGSQMFDSLEVWIVAATVERPLGRLRDPSTEFKSSPSNMLSRAQCLSATRQKVGLRSCSRLSEWLTRAIHAGVTEVMWSVRSMQWRWAWKNTTDDFGICL